MYFKNKGVSTLILSRPSTLITYIWIVKLDATNRAPTPKHGVLPLIRRQVIIPARLAVKGGCWNSPITLVSSPGGLRTGKSFPGRHQGVS